MDIVIGAHYRHVKTGRVYQVLTMAILEKTHEAVVVYSTALEKVGSIVWVRPLSEFSDGRFSPIEWETRTAPIAGEGE